MESWYQIRKDFAGPIVGLAGVLVTGAFAFAGLKTFGRWKRAKLEEKRIDVAIEALAIGYEARLVFDEIRSRLVKSHEYADMKIDGVPAGRDQRTRQQHAPYAVLKRVEARQPFFDKALALEPRFVAVFGRDTEVIFERLGEQASAFPSSRRSAFRRMRKMRPQTHPWP